MSTLEYSSDAVNTLKRFYRADIMVFVEGSEDIPFWRHIFSTFTKKKVSFRAVGGKPELEKFRAKVMAGEIEVVIAQDRDYSFVDDVREHSRILNTYGYSIENTLISSETISQLVSLMSHTDGFESDWIEESTTWLNRFCTDFKLLIYADIQNYRQSLGCVVLGDNCTRFMLTIDPTAVCPRTVRSHIRTVPVNLDETIQAEIKNLLDCNNLQLKDVVRGHFLFSGALKYIGVIVSRLRKKISLSNDALFSSLLLAFQQSFKEGHPEYLYYFREIGGIDSDDRSNHDASHSQVDVGCQAETEEGDEAVS